MAGTTGRSIARAATCVLACAAFAPTGVSAASGSATPAVMHRAWSVTTSSPPSGPVATQTAVFFSVGSRARAVALSNGHALWSVNHAMANEDVFVNTPGLSGGKVVFPVALTGRGGKFMHDPNTGSFTTLGPYLHRVYDQPVTRNGLVAAITRAYGSGYSAVTLNFAGRSWLVYADTIGRSGAGLPAIADGRAYVVAEYGPAAGQLEAFDPAKPCVPASPGSALCAPTWFHKMSGLFSPPTTSDGRRVAVSTRLNGVQVFNGNTGALVWSFDPTTYTDGITSGLGRVFVGASDSKLRVFNELGCGHPTCKPLWTADTPGVVDAAPVLAGDRVIVATRQGKIVEYDANGCGKFVCAPLAVGQIANPHSIDSMSDPIVAGNLVLLSIENQIVAFKIV